MILKVLSYEDVEQVRKWRNETLESLRTPFLLTAEMQEQFYADVICNRTSNARFWGIWVTDRGIEKFVGMCGLENIQWENGGAEISIMLNPVHHGKGHGKQAIEMLLDKAFDQLRLNRVWGECYECNKAVDFWKKIVEDYNGYYTRLPETKFYDGQYWDSIYFSIGRAGYEPNNT